MSEGVEINHEELFSGSSWNLGKTYWYIQKADTEMRNRCKSKKDESFEPTECVDFAKEVYENSIIHWWIFTKETDVEGLLKKTENTLSYVEKLKGDSFRLKKKYNTESYSNLICLIKEFMEHHEKEINELFDYVFWLHKKDILAPCMLFTYEVWGSTRLSDRTVIINSNAVEANQNEVELCTEYALGLRTGSRYTIYDVRWDIADDICNSIDSESQVSIPIPKDRLIVQTSHKTLDELAICFEHIRNSFREIIDEINRYNAPTELLHRESFWKSFILKAMSSDRIENQSWDFKETFEMWNTKNKAKADAEIKFCEQTAAFANANGGVFIVGITDKFPRKIAGIQDLENKVKFTKECIHKYMNYDTDFVNFQQVLINCEGGGCRSCLIIAVAQRKNVVHVKDQFDKFSYPIRLATGLGRSTYDKIKTSKIKILNDNYDYISNLYRFLHNK